MHSCNRKEDMLLIFHYIRRPFVQKQNLHAMKHITIYILLAFAVAGCSAENGNKPFMAAAPDYTDTRMWYIAETGAGADVFYILPTCVWDWTYTEGQTCHYADVYNPDHIAAMLPSNELAAGIFGAYANFISPYYRQITLDSWTDEKTVSERFPYAMEDVYRAFDLYMEKMNDGKPFFIAGFSQGAKCVVELVKSLDSDELQRLVAAFVIGYKVAPEDMENGNIRPAQGSSDTGGTICYNSVESPECANPGLSQSELCINPINWRCDSEPATVSDTVTVSADPEHRLLIVKGLDSDRYYNPSLGDLFVKGNYHLLELELYKDALRENVRQRLESFCAEEGPDRSGPVS